MQRISKRTSQRNQISPILRFFPIAFLIAALLGIINFFSAINYPVLDILFVLFVFYFLTLLVQFHHSFPTQAFRNKEDVWKMIIWFLIGVRFEEIIVENGVLPEKPFRHRSNKLVFLDPASVMIVTDQTKRRQILQPGIYCLDKEYEIQGIIDLRLQHRSFPTRLQISSKTEKKEDNSAYLLADTRDGYSVGAKIQCAYKLASEFGDQGNAYGYDETSNLHMLEYFKKKQLAGSLMQQVEQKLTEILATLWRDLISQYSLIELIPEGNAEQSALSSIETTMRNTLTHPNKDKYSEQDPYKFGIKIYEVRLSHFWLPMETEIAIQHHWQPGAKQSLATISTMQQQKEQVYKELGQLQAIEKYLQERNGG